MKNRAAIVMEWAWFTVGILGIAATVHSIVFAGWRKSLMLMVVSAFCMLMFFLRRKLRKASRS